MAKDKTLSKEDLTVIKLWEAGYSGSQIGAEIGKTRNAVMGKVHRLRLAGHLEHGHDRIEKRPTIEVELPKEKPKQAKTPKMRIESRAWKPKPDPSIIKKPQRNISFFELKNGLCKYSTAGHNLATYLFCGAPTGGKPYCQEHHDLCYVPREPKRKRTSNIKFLRSKGFTKNDDAA